MPATLVDYSFRDHKTRQLKINNNFKRKVVATFPVSLCLFAFLCGKFTRFIINLVFINKRVKKLSELNELLFFLEAKSTGLVFNKKGRTLEKVLQRFRAGKFIHK